MIKITEFFVIQRKSKENMNGWVTERKCMLSLGVEVWEVPSSYQILKWFFLHSKRKLRKCWQTKAWLLWQCLCPVSQITLNWWLKQRPLISHISGALKSTIEVLTDLVSGRSCFLVHRLQSSCYVLTCWKSWEKALWSLF